MLFHIVFHILFPLQTAYSTYINRDNLVGNFTINDDNNYIYNTGATLNIDLLGVAQMRFWNTPAERDSAPWQAYTGSIAWTLTTWLWLKTVYGEFENGAGSSTYVSDEIIYKQVPTLPYSTWLTLWLDANNSGSITETSWNISAWNDLSGNNYHALQWVGWSQPSISDNQVNFNGSSDYLYLENLNYTNATPLDGLLVCSVFRTPNTNTSISGNWAFLDFDRSDWFNFYNRWDGIGMSYNAWWIQDMYVSGVGINDNNLHVSCASYDNTLTNDTIITIDGNTELSEDREANGSQIGVGRATRYGFVWDGSEATSENGGRNNSYYDGGIAEILYFDSAVSSTDQQDIECYLWEKWFINVAGCWPDTIPPIARISYSPEITVNGDVVAQLTHESEAITITNNGGSDSYTFSSNGTFTFEFQDAAGNTNTVTAQVDWIDPLGPLLIGTGSVNEAPIITSYSGSTTHSLGVGSWVTDVADISATDTVYNIIWEYGHTTLSGNTWLEINHNEMCNPVAVVSHRQLVNAEVQRAPRVRNKTGTWFEVKVDNYNSTIGAISTDIDYMIMSAGNYVLDSGLTFEAGSHTTTAVACNATNAPTPDSLNFLSSFSLPPSVIHTIATENDPGWLVSWVNGNNGDRWSEPSTTQMGLVLQRSFDTCTHAPEDIDYMAFEPGHYTLLDGTEFDAVRSTDSIGSVTPWWSPISFFDTFSNPPQTALVSQLGEDGWNGSYAQIHNGGTITTTELPATTDEDGPAADRNHTNEVVASVAMSENSGQFWEENTINYSITGWADAVYFTINSTTWDLDFISGKDPNNQIDSDNNGIYEVVISACDSHCNSLCDTQTFFVDVSDVTPPSIDTTSFLSGALLPGWNHAFNINYSDLGSGVDTSSADITLHKWDGISAWWTDIAGTHLSSGTINTTVANYNINTLDFGKYQYRFTLSDNNGNTVTQNIDFYIDIPEFIISTPEIALGSLWYVSATFSPTVTVTVRTVWAWFDVTMNMWNDLESGSESIPDWDGSSGFGYESAPFTNSVSTIGSNQNIATQWVVLNTNGDKNTYTYDIQLWALIELEQIAGDYTGQIDFNIDFDYD